MIEPNAIAPDAVTETGNVIPTAVSDMVVAAWNDGQPGVIPLTLTKSGVSWTVNVSARVSVTGLTAVVTGFQFVSADDQAAYEAWDAA
jgi:hypothetical protein